MKAAARNFHRRREKRIKHNYWLINNKNVIIAISDQFINYELPECRFHAA